LHICVRLGTGSRSGRKKRSKRDESDKDFDGRGATCRGHSQIRDTSGRTPCLCLMLGAIECILIFLQSYLLISWCLGTGSRSGRSKVRRKVSGGEVTGCGHSNVCDTSGKTACRVLLNAVKMHICL
jgi:hypothetical protein